MCVFFSHSDFVLAGLKHQHLFPISPSDEDNVPHIEPLRTPVLIKTSPHQKVRALNSSCQSWTERR